MPLKLFYARGACSLAAHIALEESGAEFEAVSVNLAKGEQKSSEFVDLNPKARIPVLVTEEGVLTENPAILMYVAMRYPEANLAPVGDLFKLARIQSLNAYLSSTVHVAHAHGPRGIRWADETSSLEDMKRKVPKTMADCFSLIENDYFEGPWVMGQDYTICDMYLFTFATWLEADGVDPGSFPDILDHRNRMLERPAVKAVMVRESG
jgi:glutathione S-transferase